MNTDNLTPNHVDRLIDRALKKFARYEKRVDFDNRSASDDLYRDYQIAREAAVQAAGIVSWRKADAERLP
jgi:hypothetical protein